jgi:hypothetical protein
MSERLQKILVHTGYGNTAGLGQKDDPATDKITVDGKPLAALYPSL